jgi:hypothetical protein
MSIVKRHIKFYREIFAIPGFLSEPILMFGFQDVLGENLPEGFDYKDAGQLLAARGLTDVVTLDLFDHRADLRYDLNMPVAETEHERYGTVVDIGSVEHVFDTRQCLESCMRMVRPGGHYFVVTAVRGYLRHGFHTFHPELLEQALTINGFEIPYRQFSSKAGHRLDQPDEAEDALIWIVGRKTKPMGEFQIPQQTVWAKHYGDRRAASG